MSVCGEDAVWMLSMLNQKKQKPYSVASNEAQQAKVGRADRPMAMCSSVRIFGTSARTEDRVSVAVSVCVGGK